MTTRYRLAVLLIAAGIAVGLLGGGASAASAGTTVSAQAFALVDAGGVEHLSITRTLYTHEVVLYADNPTAPDGIELAALSGAQIDVGYVTRAIRMGAPNGIDVYGGVPLRVEGGPGSTVSADGGYIAAGRAGWSGTLPLCGGSVLTIKGGIVIGVTP